MVRSVGEMLAYISAVMTLEPGDAIYTGTPAGIGTLHDGDMVEVEIEGVGTLRNPVRVATAAPSATSASSREAW
jgi:2-keto-4-pentenoate hydratase/2-oxohepta-3-ene-1,7-dioic acid hydratase in catechol pathway